MLLLRCLTAWRLAVQQQQQHAAASSAIHMAIAAQHCSSALTRRCFLNWTHLLLAAEAADVQAYVPCRYHQFCFCVLNAAACVGTAIVRCSCSR